MSRRELLLGAAALVLGGAGPAVQTVRITARRFQFDPETVTLVVGRPAILELVSLDRTHGFRIPDLGVGTIIGDRETVRLSLTPERPGRFVFICDRFCGDGHEDMTGVLVAE
jgi:cytochrome c oxidase subunit 2